MADIDITQAEADALIAMEKHCVEDKSWLFPEAGGRLSVPLISPDKRENFMLDITRAVSEPGASSEHPHAARP